MFMTLIHCVFVIRMAFKFPKFMSIIFLSSLMVTAVAK